MVPVLASVETYGDHTSTSTAHCKMTVWYLSLALFLGQRDTWSAPNTQHGVTASAG